MKPLFVVQYYKYQYDQVKHFSEKYAKDPSDIAYYINLEDEIPEIPSIKNVDLSKYDYLIYTGMPCDSIQKYSLKTRHEFVVYIGHSLVGTIYDSRLVLPTYERSIGVVPECWLNFDSFKKVLAEQDTPRFVTTPSNHIVDQAVSEPFDEIPDPSTCAIILGEKSAFKTYNELALSLDFKKIHVKFHPLTSQENQEIFNDPRYVIHPINENKYKFINCCGTVLGGQSSLFIESYLRSLYYNKGQRFYELPNRRKTDTGFTKFGSDAYSDENVTYRSLIPQDSTVFEVFDEVLFEVEQRIMGL